MTPLGPSRGPARTPLAMDLGTSRTQIFAPGPGLLIDEPTLLATDRSGQVFAAGREAWQASVSTGARVSRPVRRGLPVTPLGGARYLSMLLTRYHLRVEGPVVLAIPAVASAYEASVLAAVPASVTGARIVPVESLLAAAIGAGLPIDNGAGGLICDLGAGILEVGAVGEGRLLARSSATVGSAEYLDDRPRLVLRAAGALQRVLDKVPDVVARELLSRPLHVVGGGALLPDIDEDLQDGLRMEVILQDDPRQAVIKGLSRCLGEALVRDADPVGSSGPPT
jgi:actin-like ATPase involved in cell morphogenesis